jgi:protein TonB
MACLGNFGFTVARMACKLTAIAKSPFTNKSLSVRYFHNHRTPKSRRLIFAVLLSLVLHILLLFFVRMAPPSWKGFSSETSPLNVILDTTPAEVAKPSAITEASQNSQGAARVGVQDNNHFSENPLTAARSTPVEQPKNSIPKDFIGKEILTAKNSAQVNMVASVPDLLATKEPDSEKPEDKEKPYAPAPSVAKSVAAAPPPVEQLVSAEPAPGERQEKIVFAEPAQTKPLAEKPGNIAEETKPVKVEEPAPVKIDEPKPVKIEEPKPIEVEKPKPVEIKKPKPVTIEAPKPIKVAEPTPVKVAEPQPAKVEEPNPAMAEPAAETKARPVEIGKSDVFRTGTPAYKIPSLAELSIASVRRLSSDDDRKIKFGERKKSVGLKEQDFRYAMYVESVRLKLQRIGMFNYPAAAARDNLSGTLSIIITIRADGSLEEFSVIQPSVYAVLNKGAENIVRMSAPFSPLPDNIRQDTDLLSIRINWSFSQSSQSFD